LRKGSAAINGPNGKTQEFGIFIVIIYRGFLPNEIRMKHEYFFASIEYL